MLHNFVFYLNKHPNCKMSFCVFFLISRQLACVECEWEPPKIDRGAKSESAACKRARRAYGAWQKGLKGIKVGLSFHKYLRLFGKRSDTKMSKICCRSR